MYSQPHPLAAPLYDLGFSGLSLQMVAQRMADYMRRHFDRQAKEPLTPQMVDILGEGRASLTDYSNIASGYGNAVWVLAAKGLLERTKVSGGVSSYEATEAGRAANLAAIGVREIYPSE